MSSPTSDSGPHRAISTVHGVVSTAALRQTLRGLAPAGVRRVSLESTDVHGSALLRDPRTAPTLPSMRRQAALAGVRGSGRTWAPLRAFSSLEPDARRRWTFVIGVLSLCGAIGVFVAVKKLTDVFAGDSVEVTLASSLAARDELMSTSVVANESALADAVAPTDSLSPTDAVVSDVAAAATAHAAAIPNLAEQEPELSENATAAPGAVPRSDEHSQGALESSELLESSQRTPQMRSTSGKRSKSSSRPAAQSQPKQRLWFPPE